MTSVVPEVLVGCCSGHSPLEGTVLVSLILNVQETHGDLEWKSSGKVQGAWWTFNLFLKDNYKYWWDSSPMIFKL